MKGNRFKYIRISQGSLYSTAGTWDPCWTPSALREYHTNGSFTSASRPPHRDAQHFWRYRKIFHISATFWISGRWKYQIGTPAFTIWWLGRNSQRKNQWRHRHSGTGGDVCPRHQVTVMPPEAHTKALTPSTLPVQGELGGTASPL